MIPCGPIVEELFDILRCWDRPEQKDRIWRTFNYQYFKLCRSYSWAALRAPTPVTLNYSASGVDSTGLWLPSDLFGIDIVWDSTNKQEFFEKDRTATLPDEWGYRYYRYYPSRSDLASYGDLVLANSAASFTSALLTAAGTAVDGEYVQFDGELGIYKITSDTTPFTFEPTYYGESKTAKVFRIRPWEMTQKMHLVDPDEDLIYDRSVSVYYWRAPIPLYREEDIILLPDAEVLKLRTLRALPEAKHDYPVSERMLETALHDALKLNHKFSRISTVRDIHNVAIDVNTNPFTAREGS